MYPKVKVREQIEEADQYSYEISSLQSLKAFEWLSLDHYSASDERPRSAVRIPSSPGFQPSKADEKNKKKVRAASAPRPRPRAVLSSPGFLGLLSEFFQNMEESEI